MQSTCFLLHSHLFHVCPSAVFFHIFLYTLDFKKDSIFRFALDFTPETFLILRRHQWNIIIGFHVKCLLFLTGFNETWIYSLDLLKPLSAELASICYLLALLAHHFLHLSRIRVKSLTLRWLMSYIYIYIWSTHSWCF